MEHPEEEAFRCVLAHRPLIKFWIVGVVKDIDLSEDLSTDVMLRIVRSWGQYDKNRPFLPWARSITRSLLREFQQRQARERMVLDEALLEDVAAAGSDITDESDFSDLRAAFSACMSRLSEQNQRIINLRFGEGQSFKVISQLTGKSVCALNTGVHRLRKVLIDCVEKAIASI